MTKAACPNCLAWVGNVVLLQVMLAENRRLATELEGCSKVAPKCDCDNAHPNLRAVAAPDADAGGNNEDVAALKDEIRQLKAELAQV